MSGPNNATTPSFEVDLSTWNSDLFALCLPVGFACGVAFATLAVSSWTLVVPILLVAAQSSPPNALFVCFVVDLCNGIFLAVRYRRLVDWSAVLIVGGIAVLCCAASSLFVGIRFVRTHDELLRNGSTFGNYAGGLIFLARAAVQFYRSWRDGVRQRQAAAVAELGAPLASFIAEGEEEEGEATLVDGHDGGGAALRADRRWAASRASVWNWSMMAEPPPTRRCCSALRRAQTLEARPRRHNTGEFAVRKYELQAFDEIERPTSLATRCCRMKCALRRAAIVAAVLVSAVVVGGGAGLDGMGGGNAFAMVFIFVLQHRSVGAAGTASAVSASMMAAMLVIYSATLALGSSALCAALDTRLPPRATTGARCARDHSPGRLTLLLLCCPLARARLLLPIDEYPKGGDVGIANSGVDPTVVWRPLLLIGAADLIGIILGSMICTRLPERCVTVVCAALLVVRVSVEPALCSPFAHRARARARSLLHADIRAWPSSLCSKVSPSS
jgi:uncharacterized membrane protein YfcA